MEPATPSLDFRFCLGGGSLSKHLESLVDSLPSDASDRQVFDILRDYIMHDPFGRNVLLSVFLRPDLREGYASSSCVVRVTAVRDRFNGYSQITHYDFFRKHGWCQSVVREG